MARRGWWSSPLVIAAGACLVFAAASLALPSGPTYDPYSWLLWGRGIAHLDLTLRGTGTSWKPLPALVDAVLSPLGSGAANGWLLIARAGAVFAGCVAFRLAWRLSSTQRGLAGTGAAVTVFLTLHWVNRNAVGGAEGLMVAFGLLAIDRHLDGHRQQAFWLIIAAALIRVEMWPFAFGYGCWLAWRGGGRSPMVAAGWSVIPLLWFGGDLIGSGSLTRGAQLADRPVHGSLANDPHPALAVLREAIGMLPPAAWVAIAIALLASRSRVLLALAGSAALWTAIVAVMTERGYPGEDRFLFMATGLEAVVAGVGCAVAASAFAASSRRRDGAAAFAAVVVAAAFAGGSLSHLQMLPADVTAVDNVADMDARLVRTVEAAGGGSAVMRCGEPTTPWFTVSALAYDLDVPATDVRSGDRVRLTAPPCGASADSTRHRPS